jgi:hypothetical protein
MAETNSLAKLLQSEPLYRKIEVEKKYWHPEQISGTTFQFFCPDDASIQTFKLSLAPENVMTAYNNSSFYDKDLLNPFTDKKSIESIQYYTGKCQYCNKYQVHFLLHLFSEGEVHKELFDTYPVTFTTPESAAYRKSLEDNSKFFVRKLGQWPSFQIKPDSTLYNFLDADDRDYYNKGLICLSQNYGVAAFAYYRRIVENEIIRIVEELTKQETSNTDNIKSLLKEYQAKRHLGPLVENIFPYLPNSLKILNDNPFKLLYGYLSEGLHSHSDEQCLSYALALDRILQFTVKKLREEQNELAEIRQIMKGLRKG